MEMTIKYGNELSVEEFNAILALDRKIFGNEILTNEGLALKRFLKCRDSIISAYSGDTLIGFIGFFNVAPTVYERGAFYQEYIDDNLSDSEIEPLKKGGENNILLFDHVIDEPFRHQGVSKLLLESTRNYLRKQHQEGYPINRIFGYAITPKGSRILSSFGGNDIWTRDGITFFEIDKEIFLRRL